MRIAILTPSLTTGDAVSNDVLGMYEALQQIADVRLFAEGGALEELRVYPPEKIHCFLKKPDDVFIYHYSRGWTPAMSFLSELTCRRVIKYHNITPPDFFATYSADFAQKCYEGRQQLKPIANAACDLFLSDSDFNMHELLAEGAPETKSRTVPPFHHIDRLTSIKGDAAVIDRFKNGHINICTVGRVAPNKGHAELITAFAAYHQDYNSESRLIIVGKQETRLARYSAMLRALIERLNVEHAVVFTGDVSDNELKAYYSLADVFVTTSRHEGFCVPLVEAMAMDLPIVAFASSAIPETVGAAGIVWNQRNPYLLAESINAIVSDTDLRRGLSALGKQRYQALFTNEQIRKKFLGVLAPLL
jgi:glycosyltransferase involved in cell wall biosynthesis